MSGRFLVVVVLEMFVFMFAATEVVSAAMSGVLLVGTLVVIECAAGAVLAGVARCGSVLGKQRV